MAEGAATAASENPDGSELPFAEGVPEDDPVPARITFTEYLSSPSSRC
jgi:hypothetical protein